MKGSLFDGVCIQCSGPWPYIWVSNFPISKKYIIKHIVIAGTVVITFTPLVEAIGVDLFVLGLYSGRLIGIVAHLKNSN